MVKGKFIVLYGINNLGKSTQAKLLIKNLEQLGLQAQYLKYPIYDLEPTGPQLNEILRGGKPQTISELELQKLYSQNRHDFQPELEKKLAAGIYVVAEDYVGTGLAWGMAKGADLEILEKQNQGLLKEDLAILFDGQRFLEGKEKNHLHESNDELMVKCRTIHLQLGEKYGWHLVNANQSVEKVAQNVWQIVKSKLD